jgi:CubicO group peptidase (beta-lactamase class C family)
MIRAVAGVIGTLVVALAASLAAQSSAPQALTAISALARAATERGDVPGVVVSVVNKDGVLYHEAFGHSRTASKAPMAKDTIFNIASMTKPVTSVAVMMLVEEGKVRLDEDVATYLPKWKNPRVIAHFNPADASFDTTPATRPITIRHLLTHTSGIGYGFASKTLAAVMAKTKQNELDLPLLFNPGDGWAYGASTRVLGHVVEAVSGQRIDAFLQARILGPLGMGDTSYLVPAAKYARVVAVNARGTDGQYVERPVPATIPATVQGDGGLYGTAHDYGLFLRMLLNRGRLGQARILSERAVRMLFENHMGRVVVGTQESSNLALSRDFPLGAGHDRWGLGFQLQAERLANRRTPGSGTWAGIFNTHFFIDPARDRGVIVMMQTLPFYDEAAMRLYAGVEEAVYRAVR